MLNVVFPSPWGAETQLPQAVHDGHLHAPTRHLQPSAREDTEDARARGEHARCEDTRTRGHEDTVYTHTGIHTHSWGRAVHLQVLHIVSVTAVQQQAAAGQQRVPGIALSCPAIVVLRLHLLRQTAAALAPAPTRVGPARRQGEAAARHACQVRSGPHERPGVAGLP